MQGNDVAAQQTAQQALVTALGKNPLINSLESWGDLAADSIAENPALIPEVIVNGLLVGVILFGGTIGSALENVVSAIGSTIGSTINGIADTIEAIISGIESFFQNNPVSDDAWSASFDVGSGSNAIDL